MLNSYTSRNIWGFSLIELLIVVLIIGIISSISVLYIDTTHERLKSEVQRLSQLIKAAGEQAVISGKPMAMTFEPSEYYFSQWNGAKWQRINFSPFRTQSLKANIRLDFKRENNNFRDQNNSEFNPGLYNMIYFLPTGETETFSVLMSSFNMANKRDLETYQVHVSFMGDLSVKQVSN